MSEAPAVKLGCRRVMKIAVDVINVLGLILMAAATGCWMAGLQVPAIALLVSGFATLFVSSAAFLVLEFVLPKNQEATSVSNLNPKATPITDLREALSAKINSIPESWVEGLNENVDAVFTENNELVMALSKKVPH